MLNEICTALKKDGDERKQVAILGGSFDPPTISHLQVSPNLNV